MVRVALTIVGEGDQGCTFASASDRGRKVGASTSSTYDALWVPRRAFV